MKTLVPYRETNAKFIPEQYKNSRRLLSMIYAVLNQCDEIEIALFEILEALNVETAIGNALDYIGEIVGVARNLNESDDDYRERIQRGGSLSGLPTNEALRNVIKFVTGSEKVGLYPCWPAMTYFVIDGATEADLSNVEEESMTSGAELVRGTFLVGEDDEFGYIVSEDNEMPIVVDYTYPPKSKSLLTETGMKILTEEGLPLLFENKGV